MLKFKASTLIAFSGAIWLAVGSYLLPLGLNLLMQSSKFPEPGFTPLLTALSSLNLSFEQAALLIVVLGLGIGFVKGKMVFAKTVNKSVERILSFSPPVPLMKVYSVKYCVLLAFMVLLGISFKYFGFSNDVRGFIDIAIGSALINGSTIYFRQAFKVWDKERTA